MIEPRSSASAHGEGPTADLATRIDGALRERLEDAVDAACLEAMVTRRHAHGLPAPATDSGADRDEFAREVRAFLVRLSALADALTPEQRGRVESSASSSGRSAPDLLAVQVALARELPDYWQRFETARTAYASERVGSGGERRGLLRRLFGRG